MFLSEKRDFVWILIFWSVNTYTLIIINITIQADETFQFLQFNVK